MIRQLFRAIAPLLVAAAGLAVPATAQTPAPNWNATVTRTADDSYILGNPAAPVRLVTYISYSCPHCAEFEAEADAQLRIGMIGPGKGALEVRPFLRNPIDIAASLLVECGPPAKFFANHALFLRTQGEWMSIAMNQTDAQKARWENPDFAARMRAIASDLHFYELMEKRGYDRPALDRCLANRALADRMAQHTRDASDKEFIKGTPAFLIDGIPLAGTATWELLKPQLEARLH